MASAFTFMTKCMKILFGVILPYVSWKKWLVIPLIVLVRVFLQTIGIYIIYRGRTFSGWKIDPVAMPFALLTVLLVVFSGGLMIKDILPRKQHKQIES